MLHSIYDLTTLCRRTLGDVPPKLVGASTTVVGSKMYLFGGRLVTQRRMTSDLYMFNLETFEWEYIPTFPEDDIPQPRYFHSTDSWNNHLVLFGGMSNRPDSLNPDDLCVLNDVRLFDLESRHWLPEEPLKLSPDDPNVPGARYAHLSSITANRLFVIGGQDFFNTWLDDICVYDIVLKTWVQKRDYPRHCGTYRSVAVSSAYTVRIPQDEAQSSDTLGPSGTRFQMDKSTPLAGVTPFNTLTHLPYTAQPTDEHPSDIFLYSNYNFTDVKRELEVFSPLPGTDFIVNDRSERMTGSTLPPGLRFPTGAVLGTHLIIAGTYLAHSYQSFSIWVLDLVSMVWSRIDPGKAIESGSWFRGCLWAEGNKFYTFGNRKGNLVDDYNRRLLSWDHVAVTDLEAFGIYQPPSLRIDISMQELGLAVLEEQALADFEIVCDDNRRISCSRKILEDRWPWFKLQRIRMLYRAQAASNRLPTSDMHVDLPVLPGTASVEEIQLDPRLTPRVLFLSEPWPVTMALLQYFYTTALITPLQHAPAVLSQLLVLGATYQLNHLVSLVTHAMHLALSNSNSVAVYEVATLCGCRGLQIRALKTVMSYTQKKPSKSSRHDRENGHDRHSGGTNGKSDDFHGDNGRSSRPRGTSDTRWKSIGGPVSGMLFASREGDFLPAEYTQSRKGCANCSESQRSSGSALSQAQPQPTFMPIASSRTKHMTENARRVHRRSDSPRGSNEWDFLSSFPAVPGTLHKINLTTRSTPTPSKQWSVSHGARSGILKSPKPSDHSEPVMTSIRHRPSQASTFTADTGRTAVKQLKHTQNLSSSSSSSNDLQTPTSPSRNGLEMMPKVHHEHQGHDASDIDDEFALVSNGEEAIHWTKQTSDLRQLSPTRSRPSERENRSSSSPSLSSTSRSRLPLPTQKLVSSPSKPRSQSSASPTKSDGQQSKLDQRARDRFGFSPSPTRVRPPNSVTSSHIKRGM